MNLARRTVILRGYLGRDVEVSGEPCVVLALLIESAISDKATGLRIARTTQVPVVCCAPDYSGAHSHLNIEVEGELCFCEEDGPVVWSRDPRVMRVAGIKVRATHVREVNTPEASAAS
jgi:hypothetical protein